MFYSNPQLIYCAISSQFVHVQLYSLFHGKRTNEKSFHEYRRKSPNKWLYRPIFDSFHSFFHSSWAHKIGIVINERMNERTSELIVNCNGIKLFLIASYSNKKNQLHRVIILLFIFSFIIAISAHFLNERSRVNCVYFLCLSSHSRSYCVCVCIIPLHTHQWQTKCHFCIHPFHSGFFFPALPFS